MQCFGTPRAVSAPVQEASQLVDQDMNAIAQLFSCSSLTRNALEISPSAVVVANDSGTILFANQHVSDWFGYALSDMNGLALEGLLPAIAARDYDAHRAHGMSHPSNIPATNIPLAEGPQRVICKDGSELIVQVKLVAVQEQSQQLILANFDRTDQETLDHQLLESERLDAIATTISGLAHESRNALQRAVACLDLMELDLKEDVRQMELAAKIRKSLSDLLANYDEVRRFALPIALSREPIELLPLCLEAYCELEEERGISRCEFFIAGGNRADSLANVDRERIKEVFHHVIENALEQHDGNVKIMVDCEPAELRHQEALKIQIYDDGAPFSPEALQRALEPFYTTKQQGTGLGLSICRRVVRAHGGVIRVKNPEGGGALVEILLPKAASAPALSG